jgi:hypothetical protein
MEKQYLEMLRGDMRQAVAQFIKFDRKWNALNDALNLKFSEEGRDIVAIDQMKSANITLTGYMSSASWWRDKAAMLAAVLSAEQAADTMIRNQR